MDSLYLLIPIAVIFVTIAVVIFFWAVDNNQFDDLEGPAHSILFDEPESRPKAAPSKAVPSTKAPPNQDKQNNSEDET